MIHTAIFASGNGSNFENLVSAMQNGTIMHADCKLLVVDKKDAFALQRAEKLGIPHIFVDPKAFANKEAYETYILEKLKEQKIDLIVLSGYMRFIGSVLLANYRNRIINLHPAYLPNFPGAHSIEEAYHAKAEFTGVTIHYVDEGVDTGTIIHQEKIMIDKDWTLEQLEDQVHALEYDMFPRVLNQLVQTLNEEIKHNRKERRDLYETSIGECI